VTKKTSGAGVQDKKKKLPFMYEAQYSTSRRRDEAWAMCGRLPVPGGYCSD